MFNWQINFDWSWLYALGSQPLYEIIWQVFAGGGWIVFILVVLYGSWINYVFIMQGRFAASQNYIFLAIDIPKENLQTPRAVENIFVALSGAHSPGEFYERKIRGEFQLGFSIEIVSIDGYIQFLIRTPSQFRHLVEASIYSHYPDAEITEVRDYTADINPTFPNDEYNLWGTDLVLVRDDYFPLRTYIEFQEELDKEFKDPMAALLEVLSKIGPGEQIWVQIIILPADIGWEKPGLEAANKLMGIAKPLKKGMIEKIVESPITALQFLANEVLSGGEMVEEKPKVERFNMMALPPKEKKEVEAILKKVDKICFSSKIRFVYYAKKEVFKKGLAVSGMFGAFKQFGSSALNGFKPGSNKTTVRYGFKDFRENYRKNKILADFKARNIFTCKGPSLLNIEELATIFHFPHIEIKAPLVHRIESKRARAPIGLPVEAEPYAGEESAEPAAEAEETGGKKARTIDYDNDYFEKRFAIDQTGESDRKRKEKVLKELKIAGAVDKPAKHNLEKEDAPDNLPFI